MILAIIIGATLGIISGILPGVHNNTFSSILIANLPILYLFFTPEEVAVIILTNAIIHTFTDILPSIFIGVPDEDTAISLLPGHEMVLSGNGFRAVFISAISSLSSFFIALPVFYFFLSVDKIFWRIVVTYTKYFLVCVVAYLIFLEKGERFAGSLNFIYKKAIAILIFILSGITGILAFSFSYMAEIRVGSSIFIPLMTGFFAIPVLLHTTKTKIPRQNITLPSLNETLSILKSIFSGSIAGSMVSVFPGISSGIAGTISSGRSVRREDYISAVSSANTSNAILCFSVLFATGKTRSGAVSAFKQVVGYALHMPEIRNLIVISVLSAIFGFIITILLGIWISKTISEIDVSRLSVIILTFVVAFNLYMTGLFGGVILLISSLIGFLAIKLRVRRIMCMGCIILPVLLS